MLHSLAASYKITNSLQDNEKFILKVLDDVNDDTPHIIISARTELCLLRKQAAHKR